MKERSLSFVVIAALVTLLLLLPAAPAAAADGEVYLIDSSGTTVGTYTSIKDAANDAQDGYTILVSPGTYNEYDIEINRENITLKSTDGAAVTIIDSRDPDNNTDCIRSYASSFSIEGFTLIYHNDCCIYGGSDFNNGKITIKDNIIRGYDDGSHNTGHGIYLTVTSTAAADTDIEITGNDIVVNGQDNAAICLEMDLVRSRVEISDNNIPDSSTGIDLRCQIGYPGDQDAASKVEIKNNTIGTADNVGISVGDLYHGSLHITGNQLTNCRNGIEISSCGAGGVETDVQVLNNKITPSETPQDWVYESAIHIDFPERVTRIEGNTIIGSYNYGIYLGTIGGSVKEFKGHILNNKVEFCAKGLYINDLHLSDDKGSLKINSNDFANNDYGFYIEDKDESEDETLSFFFKDLELKNNTFKDHYANGVLLFFADDEGYETLISILVEANLFEGNFCGMRLDTNMAVEDSEVLIRDNYFKDNNCGLFLHNGSPNVKIYLNAFIENDYGLDNGGGPPLDARFNWWGSPAGPTVEIASYYYSAVTSLASLAENGGSTTRDIVAMLNEGAVRYDPWLTALDLSPAAATAAVNSIHTLTAALRDNEGDLVNLAGLRLAISVAGTHNLDDYAALNLGLIEWGYKGTAIGNDTVSATVLFAGRPAGLEGTAAVTWVAAPVKEPDQDEPGKEEPGKEKRPPMELPNTGSGLPWLILSGMLALAGIGAASRSRRIN